MAGNQPVADALAGDVSLPGRTWRDRVRPASWKSPSGLAFTFHYEAVSRETPLRGTIFDFADVDGGYVQRLGFGSRRYPMVCYFTGDHHDRNATAFEKSLLEPGIGRLTHPYGTFDAVPFGTLGRRNEMVREANQSVVEVEFFTTIGSLYPSGQGDPRNEVLDSLATFQEQTAAQFAESARVTTTIAKANTRNDFHGLLQKVDGALKSVARATASVDREFRAQMRNVDFGLDVLVDTPIDLVMQVAALIELPATAASEIIDRLAGYARLAASVFATSSAPSSGAINSENLPSLRLRQRNTLHASDAVAMCAVAGSVRSVVETQFRTRQAALRAAESVLLQLDDAVVWRDREFEALEEIDTGGSYQALQQSVALVAGYLVQISFTLQPERRIKLDRARTIIDLAAELFGDVSNERLDFLIAANNLSGSEILELPVGKIIVYY